MKITKRIKQFLLDFWYWLGREFEFGYAKPGPYWVRTFTPQELSRQQKCRHLKGSLGFPRGPVSDYNVNMHTFIDGKSRIKCLSCGWEVWNLPGYTFKWNEGVKMVNNSTNTPSSSEVMLTPAPNLPGVPLGYQDHRAIRYAPEYPAADMENPIRGAGFTDVDYALAKKREKEQKKPGKSK